MKRELRKTVDGKEVVRLVPESEEDLAEIRRLDEAGLVDARTNFADDPSAWHKHPSQPTPSASKRRAVGQ